MDPLNTALAADPSAAPASPSGETPTNLPTLDGAMAFMERLQAPDPAPENPPEIVPEAEVEPAEPAAPEAEAVTLPAAEAAPEPTAEAKPPAHVPYDRFQEVNRKFRDTEAELTAAREQLDSLNPWRTVAETLAPNGITPEQLLAEWSALLETPQPEPAAAPVPAPAATPEVPPLTAETAAQPFPELGEWALTQGVPDVYDLEPDAYEAWEKAHAVAAQAHQQGQQYSALEARLNQWEAQQRASQEAAQQAEQATAAERWKLAVTANLAALQPKYPVLADPQIGERMQREAVQEWVAQGQQQPLESFVRTLQAADDARIERLVAERTQQLTESQRQAEIQSRNQLVEQAVAANPTAAPSARPVLAGGGNPPVAVAPDLTQLSEHQRRQGAAEWLAQRMQGARQ